MTASATTPRGIRSLLAPVLVALGATAIALGLTLGGSGAAARSQGDQGVATPDGGDQGGGRAPAAPVGGAPDDGRRLYLTSCVNCHGPDGGGTVDGPSLLRSGEAITDFYLRTGRMPLSDPVPQPPSKPVAFTDPQIKALVAYVGSLCDRSAPCPPIPSLEPGSADLERGAELYLANCSPCHNSIAVGGALSYGRHAPSLQETPPVQVAEAVRTGPGQMPRFGPEVLSDADVNDIVRYVEFLHEPPSPGGANLGFTGPVAEGFVALLLGLGALVLACRWITREPSAAAVQARPQSSERRSP